MSMNKQLFKFHIHPRDLLNSVNHSHIKFLYYKCSFFFVIVLQTNYYVDTCCIEPTNYHCDNKSTISIAHNLIQYDSVNMYKCNYHVSNRSFYTF